RVLGSGRQAGARGATGQKRRLRATGQVAAGGGQMGRGALPGCTPVIRDRGLIGRVEDHAERPACAGLGPAETRAGAFRTVAPGGAVPDVGVVEDPVVAVVVSAVAS